MKIICERNYDHFYIVRCFASRKEKKVLDRQILKGGLSNSAAMARIRTRWENASRDALLRPGASDRVVDATLNSLAAEKFVE